MQDIENFDDYGGSSPPTAFDDWGGRGVSPGKIPKFSAATACRVGNSDMRDIKIRQNRHRYALEMEVLPEPPSGDCGRSILAAN